jgi:hypothetical protein
MPSWATYTPTIEEATAACQYNGKTAPHAVAMLMTGKYAHISSKVLMKDIVKQWRPSTIAAKERTVKAFFTFLKAIGSMERFFPASGEIPCKSESHSRDQEHSLCQYAMLRMASGQNRAGAEGVVSHIRTWYRSLFDEEYGKVGKDKKASMTSQYLKAMGEYFPRDESRDKKRDPITWAMVQMMVQSARKQNWWDIGVAVAVAYAALLRMGEATSSESRAFNASEDLAEKHLTFLPTFWQADRVVIQLGRTKTDQDGSKARYRPRVIPVDGVAGTPGQLLREMIIRRHRLAIGEVPMLGNDPLFQDKYGRQLQRDVVLKFMRKTLIDNGMSPDAALCIGTHSCRIGGATRLFQLGATAEVLKQFGGWVSDAWRVYIRLEQIDLMKYTRAMCC